MNATEEKLIQVIANHYLSADGGKITLKKIAESAGISRQALDKYYSHLKSYALGRKPITELLSLDDASNSELFLKSQKTINGLKSEIDQLLKKQESDMVAFKNKYITSLMNNDIAAHSANETRILAEKKGLQVDSLIKEVSQLKTQLTLERENRANNVPSSSPSDSRNQIFDFPVDLWGAYNSFVKSGDVDALENERIALCTTAINKINKKLKTSSDARVYIFVERYLSSYNEFLKTISTGEPTRIYSLKLPIHSRVELKSLRSLIDSSVRVEVYVPVTASVAIAKANRTFLFRDVPDSEFLAADKMDFPIIKDGYTKIILFDIKVGL